jgi:hypothetical protein
VFNTISEMATLRSAVTFILAKKIKDEDKGTSDFLTPAHWRRREDSDSLSCLNSSLFSLKPPHLNVIFNLYSCTSYAIQVIHLLSYTYGVIPSFRIYLLSSYCMLWTVQVSRVKATRIQSFFPKVS